MIHTCIIVIAISGLSLMYFFYNNKNHKIERYYYHENRLMFALLMFINFVLAVSLVMNSRHLITEVSKMFLMNFQIIKDIAKWKDSIVKKAYS